MKALSSLNEVAFVVQTGGGDFGLERGLGLGWIRENKPFQNQDVILGVDHGSRFVFG